MLEESLLSFFIQSRLKNPLLTNVAGGTTDPLRAKGPLANSMRWLDHDLLFVS